METILGELHEGLKALIEHLKEELSGIRSNRPSVGILEKLPVSAYGQMMTIQELGSLAVRPPRDIEISIWDQSVTGAVMKAIQEANMGFSVANDGNLIRASLPQLSEERREEFMKLAKRTTDQAKIQVRSKRDDANKKAKAGEDEGILTEDQVFKTKEKIQEVTDKVNKEIDTLLEKKIQDLSE
jgi:ribosome recycling factor